MKENAQEDRRNDLFSFVFFCFLLFSLNVHSSISKKISLLDDRNIIYKRRERRGQSVTFCFCFFVVVVVFII